jgi:predicted nucleic acid-binding protein
MGAALRIYLDACALSRLTDDPGQKRVAMEAEAMEMVFRLIKAGRATWVASSILETELRKDTDTQRRQDALAMLRQASEMHFPNSQIAERSIRLHTLGYGEFDAVHLAIAEYSKADVLLTTDYRFLRQARRKLGMPSVRVANPLDYVQEVMP